MAEHDTIRALGNQTSALDAIFKSAKDCRAKFRYIIGSCAVNVKVIGRVGLLSQLRPEISFDDFIDDFEQFKVWVRNLGVFAPDQTSLDYRLREAKDVKGGIVGLLQSLLEDLDALSLLIDDDRIIDGKQDRGNDSEESDANSSSDDSDFDNEDATSRSAYEVQARLHRVTSTISKLMHIAEIIRSSNPTARAVRSATYVHFENGVNVTEQFEKEFLPLVLKLRYKLKPELIDRFVKVIGLKRRKFQYQAKHQERLAYERDDDNDGAGRFSFTPHTASRSRITISAGSGAQLETKTAPLGVLKTGYSQSNLLTVATTFKAAQSRRAAPSTIVSAQSKATSAGPDFPPPPTIPQRAMNFECPYCFILLPKDKFLVGNSRSFSRNLWNKHVVADLQPYICLEDNCPKPYLQFETRDEWLNHQKWDHSMEWWCEGDSADCDGDINHKPVKFDTMDGYIDHAQQAHHQSSHTALKQASAAGRPSLLPFNACPFCDFDSSASRQDMPKDESDVFSESMRAQKILQRHICDELTNIFLLALPERDDIRDIDTETGRRLVDRGSTVRALDDITLSFNEDLQLDLKSSTAGQALLDFELSKTPYEYMSEGTDINSWDDVWESPQLQECVRTSYTGAENDPNLQEMLAISSGDTSTKDESAESVPEKWIPTLIINSAEDDEPSEILVVGRLLSNEVRGFGISLAEEMEKGISSISFAL